MSVTTCSLKPSHDILMAVAWSLLILAWREPVCAQAPSSIPTVTSSATSASLARSMTPLRGRIIDDQSGASLPDVSVIAILGSDTLDRTRSDSAGFFAFRTLPAMDVVLFLRHLGHELGSVTVQRADRQRSLNLAMSRITPQLAGVTVTAAPVLARHSALDGFEYHASHALGGAYIQRADLEAAQVIRLSEMMRRVTGVRLIDEQGVLVVASSRGYQSGIRRGDPMAPCVLPVVVDGQMKERLFSINSIDPKSIAGVEVYSGPATIPPFFASMHPDAGCGLVAIWTRTAP